VNKFNLDYIDSMRGIAILMVLTVHSTMFLSIYNIEHLPYNIENILYSGKYGVALFFIASAYTLFRSLDIRHENGFKKYFIRRFFRIAPMYYLVLVVLFLLTDGQKYYLNDTEKDISIYNLLSHLFFINGFFTNYFNSIIGVEWTIFVEFSFYLILPLLFIYRGYLVQIGLVFFVMSMLAGISVKLINIGLVQIQILFSPLIWYIVFLLGGLIYQSQNNPKIQSILTKNKYLLLILVGLLFSALSYIHIPGSYLGFSLILALFFMLNKFNKFKIFNNFILKRIGELSFSIYLIHMPILMYVKNTKNGGGIMMFENNYLNYIFLCLIIFSFVIFVSSLTYKYIEQPFIKLGKNYITRGNK